MNFDLVGIVRNEFFFMDFINTNNFNTHKLNLKLLGFLACLYEIFMNRLIYSSHVGIGAG